MDPSALDPETLFALSGPVALVGWLALLLAPLAPRLADVLAGIAIPALLAVAYTGLVLAFFSGAPGGFDSLANVMALFTDPHVALAGWLHYLAFDLLVGAWIVRTGRTAGMPHWLILPALPPTFLFGPAGFLVFLALRTTWSAVSGRRAARDTVPGAPR
ncbi:ABA4-like family protein [Salinarimonas sp. NSM]|uniref:ABA4-like family protein n=1 Tax=Salinarimonas sp. NSM TaxID=3458003 RepID=UPI0040366D17